MSNNRKLDWSSFSDPEDCVDLYGQAIRFGASDEEYSDSVLFKAVALTDSFPLTANQLMAIDGGATGNESGNNQRTAFRARIIGGSSPHSFLSDPCDPSIAGDLDYVYKMITMHTLFVNKSATLDVPVTRGDIVLVRLNRSNQTFNLEYGIFEELLAIEDPTGNEGERCSSLIDLFGEIEHVPFPTWAGGAGNPVGAPAVWVDSGEAEGHWTEPKACGSEMVPTYFRFSKSLAALDPNIRGRFQKFFELAAAAGVRATITSVRRSPKHQWVLQKWGKRCYGAMTPAAPCYSQHQYGFAVDVVFTYNGRKCLNANGCIPRILMPIVRNNNLRIKQIGDQDYVHWQSTDANDHAVYMERRKKCIQYYYKDNEYTAQYGSTKSAALKWPHDFTDNLEVIGVGSTPAIASGPTDSPASGGDWELGVNWVWVTSDGKDTMTKPPEGKWREINPPIERPEADGEGVEIT